jgi:putative nucleotidyltransferase with HDIG domain
MSVAARWTHLIRRFFGSLSRRPPAADAESWAQSWLRPAEAELWQRMDVADRRHAIEVAHRFAERAPGVGRAAMAGALLHDVGKLHSGLGTIGRVVATLVPARWARGRLAGYRDHEAVGAAMLRDAGSDPLTIALVARTDGSPAELVTALAAADDV